LLEAVVALAVVGVASVAALGAFGAELHTAARAQRALEASALAEYQWARLQLLAPQELRPLPDSLASGRFAPPFDTYRWKSTARALPNEEGLIDLTVRIEWEDGAYALQGRLYRPERIIELP